MAESKMTRRTGLALVAAVAAGIVVLPLPLLPDAEAHANEIDRLKPAYWALAERTNKAEERGVGSAEFQRALAEQSAARVHLHLIGCHIDDGDDPCEYSGYVGAWRLLFARFWA